MIGLAIQRASRAFLPDRPGTGAHSVTSPRQAALASITLLGIVLLGIGLRLLPVIITPSVNWGDEIFQAIEPAHRLVFGYGLVPWEFQLGMRSWLLPGVVAGLMEVSRLLGDGPGYYLPLIAVAFALLGCAPIVCCFLWCRRWFGIPAALVAAVAVSVAPELVYFGARTLTEVVAAHLMIVGCYLLDTGDTEPSRRRLVTAGALLGLACLLRIHLAPALAIAVLWSSGENWRPRLSAVAAGGLAAWAMGALLDWATLGYPFASVWRNFLYNIVYGVSAEFGTEPWNYYILGEFGLWGAGGILVLGLAALGACRAPTLLVTAAVVVAVHSAIAHKEYRFIYPAVLLVTALAAIGLAQATELGIAWLSTRGIRRLAAGTASAGFVLCYWGILVWSPFAGVGGSDLRRRAHDNLSAVSVASHLPGLCGLGLYGLEGRDWVWYGGYSYLHRRVPMYWPADASELSSQAAAFDTLLYTAEVPPELGFEPVRCFGKVCLARRPGRCEAQAMSPMPFPDALVGMAPPQEEFTAFPAQPRESSP